MKNLKIELFFAWYDFWVGLYFNRKEKSVYICLIPCLVIKIYKDTPKKIDYLEISSNRFINSTLVIPEISEEDLERVVQNIMNYHEKFYRKQFFRGLDK